MPKGLRKDSDSDLKKYHWNAIERIYSTSCIYFKETFNAQPHGPMTPQRRFGPCKNWHWSTSSCHLSVNFLGMAMWESQRTCPNGYLSSLQWNGRVVAGSRFERKHLISNERSGEVLACISGSPFKWACSQLVGTTGNTNAWRWDCI